MREAADQRQQREARDADRQRDPADRADERFPGLGRVGRVVGLGARIAAVHRGLRRGGSACTRWTHSRQWPPLPPPSIRAGASGIFARGRKCASKGRRKREGRLAAPFTGTSSTPEADYTRRLYSPVRVSTSILSPVVTNSGTATSKPLASFAGFITLPDVSPLTAGSV